MDAAALAFSAAQTLLAALSCPHLKQIFSIWGYQSELQNLERTVSSVQAVLLDAQSRDHFKFTHFERDSIQKLKDALYDADDLLDEFATLARQSLITDDNFLGKVRGLFPRFKKLKTVYKMSKEVKNIRKMLDQTTREAALFGFKVKLDPQQYRVFSRDETHSYANENSIVGREEDKRRIVDMLLDPNVQDDFCVLTIVGVGGLGKTALAQLVYNHPRIQVEFHSKIWVCVSDQDQNKPDLGKLVLAKILGTDHNQTYDSIVQNLRKKLGEGKYMLVLDDVWTEDPFHCQEWLDVLKGSSQRGSRIVVTTRSKATATAVGSKYVHELQGLSDENSWRLFEMVVGEDQANHHDLIIMGKDIVKKCANVPLAIKVLGRLLSGQDRNKWYRFHQSKLNEIAEGDHIMNILKLSYYHLPLELKTCFAYCAIFPKDLIISKKQLLWLWMAQGYVKPINGVQVVEEAAEEYFQILAQRHFFQDFQWRDNREEITSFKIHDLMHDMAQEVAGTEIVVGSSYPTSLDKRVRHFFDDRPLSHHANNIQIKSKIRTYVQELAFRQRTNRFPVSSLLANWRCLRSLDLTCLNIEILPSEISELLHLRYINLSSNGLKMLPESFTKLINLEILILNRCCDLTELPKDFSKLVNLRTLQVCGGEYPEWFLWLRLSYMPLGMEKLTSLRQLDGFVVANRDSTLKHDIGGLRGLKGLTNLRGSFKIWISPHYEHVKKDGGEGYLRNKEHLKDIYILFGSKDGEVSERDKHSDEALLEDLMPHPNLQVLTIQGYKGVKILRRTRQDNLAMFLPNLVKIFFCHMNKLQELPSLSRLTSLKVLKFSFMERLMYMESKITGDDSNTSFGASTETIQKYSSSPFFPSLEELHLTYLPMLEGWWNRMSKPMHRSASRTVNIDEMENSSNSMQANKDHPVLPSFPCLSILNIYHCPRLTCIPLCPTVEKIELDDFTEKLQIMIEDIEEENQGEAGGSNGWGNSSHVPKLRYLKTDNLRYLRSLPGKALHNLEEIEVAWDDKVKSLSEIGEALQSCSSSLRSLQLRGCKNLRSLSGGLEYLTVLDSLVLPHCYSLRSEEDDMRWRCLGHCLHSLKMTIHNMPREMANLTSLRSLEVYDLEEIPEWIGCLSSLQSLFINGSCNMQSVPEGMQKLTSLASLGICSRSENLVKRCQPDGEDWPKIQHIPHINVDDIHELLFSSAT